jgi:hypothetical protein
MTPKNGQTGSFRNPFTHPAPQGAGCAFITMTKKNAKSRQECSVLLKHDILVANVACLPKRNLSITSSIKSI